MYKYSIIKCVSRIDKPSWTGVKNSSITQTPGSGICHNVGIHSSIKAILFTISQVEVSIILSHLADIVEQEDYKRVRTVFHLKQWQMFFRRFTLLGVHQHLSACNTQRYQRHDNCGLFLLFYTLLFLSRQRGRYQLLKL